MANQIPERKDVKESDKWDLSTLYKSKDDWEKALASVPSLTEKVVAFKGKMGESADSLLGALKAYEELMKVVESVANYAGLLLTEDEGNAESLDMDGRVTMAYSKATAELAFFDPEVIAIDDKKIEEWISKSEFDDYRIFVRKLRHYKPYILSEKEERILSLQTESGETAKSAYSALTNVDLQFGTVNVNGEEKPLT